MRKLLHILLFISLPFIAISQNIKGDNLKIKEKSKLIGQVTIGSSSFNSSAILTIESSSKGMLTPRMTTAQRDGIGSPSTGLLIFNTTTNQFEFFETTWQAIGGIGGNTIYSADDALAGNRVVTMGANSLTFSGNQTTFKGINASGGSISILTTDGSDVATFRIENNGVINLAGISGNYVRISKSGGVQTFTSDIAKGNFFNGTLTLHKSNGDIVHNLNTSTHSYLQDNSVNLGIGETSPTAKLHVSGDDATSNNFAFKAQDNVDTDLFSIRNDGPVITNISLNYHVDTSATNDTYGIDEPILVAYSTGMNLYVNIGVANTGVATLQINALAAITIKKLHDQDLVTGDIEAGQIIHVIYDGTFFQLLSAIAQ